MHRKRLRTASAIAIAISSIAMPALAQEADATQGLDDGAAGEIIVTARKRAESDISVPVSITALDSGQIERKAIFDTFDLAQRTPTIAVNNNASGVGGSIYIRGIGSNVNNGPSIDQSVAFDFDGVSISRGNFLRIGNYDLEQIEILKGPQALFFGKNSPAGVVAFSSKDPTDIFDASIKLGYEPYAQTRFVEAGIGGPVSSTLKLRVFGRYGASEGRDRNRSDLALPANLIVPNAVFAADGRFPRYKDIFVRGTAIWDPTDRLNIRLKASYNDRDGEGPGSLRERFYCPRGSAQTAALAGLLAGGPNPALASALAVDDCKLNGTTFIGDLNPALLTAPGGPRDPRGGASSKILLASAEVKWEMTDQFSLTSVTGFARAKEFGWDHFTFSPAAPTLLNVGNGVKHRQFTEELRLESDLDGPLNFMVGGFYQDAHFQSVSYNLAVAPYVRPVYHIPNEVLSAFAQLTWDITDQLELAGGARYTDEKKRLTLLRDGVIQPIANPRVSFSNTSPEATLSWRPSSRMTLYGAYKTGFKSGGYATTLVGNVAPLSATTLSDFTFKPEKAEGFEIGWKAQLFDRQLRIDATAYSYTYKNLQVGNVDTSTGVPLIQISNAATAKQKGIELEANYHTSIDGLRLNAAANYNHANYIDYLAPCYVGQSVTEGCSINLLAGQFRQQQLAGRQVPNAPRWVANAGFAYEASLFSGSRFEISGDAAYRSSYNVVADLQPQGRQRSYTTFNLQLRVIDEAGRWEAGIYAKNLANVRRAIEGNVIALTGVSANTGTASGGPMSHADIGGSTNPGRTILFQLTLRPSAW